MLNFCPVCKSLLLLKEENGKTIGVCSCGFKRTQMDLSSLEHNEKEARGDVILNKNINDGFLHKCKKCGHDFAEVADLGEILSSEASVFLYTCKKCGNVERDSGGKA